MQLKRCNWQVTEVRNGKAGSEGLTYRLCLKKQELSATTHRLAPTARQYPKPHGLSRVQLE